MDGSCAKNGAQPKNAQQSEWYEFVISHFSHLALCLEPDESC
jgi:hypothetical protein